MATERTSAERTLGDGAASPDFLGAATTIVSSDPECLDPLCAMSAIELRAHYVSRAISPREVIDAVLAQIERLDPLVNAFFTVTSDLARRQSEDAEAAYSRGETSRPLLGIPVSVKDLIPTSGVRTTQGSGIYEHDVPEEDAPAVERLLAAGAVLVGKTSTSEFGWKAPPAGTFYPPTRNPWNLERTSAGSSGGAAVAVATGMGPLAIGTDGGGSIRLPASACGVVGLKPSAGRVPMAPPSDLGQLDNTGPLTRSVRDAALMMDVLAGPDARDPYSLPRYPGRFVEEVEGGIRGLRVAWSGDLGYAYCDPEVAAIAERAARGFEQLGCSIEAGHPDWTDPSSTFNTLCFELWGATMRALLPASEDRMDPELVALVKQTGRKSSADVARALHHKAALHEQASQFFERFDLLLTPTTARPAFELGLAIPDRIGDRPAMGVDWMPFTYPFNMIGHPAISVPAGWTKEGLPVGLQIAGPWHADALVLKAAAAYEAVANWSHTWPPLVHRQAVGGSPGGSAQQS
jgi:aspartyl-tRNA(Asn)/glutamyl-tRNA(Gln) amidotransferase subunit A